MDAVSPAYDAVDTEVRRAGLGIVGGFHPGAEDNLPDTATLLLLGPADGTLWAAFTAAPEAADGHPHPMDRWSKRVIDGLALDLGAQALYPFGGPPYAPFQRWAARAEAAMSSPVGMQATPGRGLWASYRGALCFGHALDLPKRPTAAPCTPCPQPCRTACPVNAFEAGTYDVPACTAHVTGPEGAACRDGCLVRRACPAGRALDLPAAQRRFHMAAFLAANA